MAHELSLRPMETILASIPSPLSPSTDCSDISGQYCGRWLDIDLTAALADLNSESDTFAFGASVADISGIPGEAYKIEQITSAVFELAPHLQNYETPPPQLLLTAVPVPSALWLFGTGGLV